MRASQWEGPLARWNCYRMASPSCRQIQDIQLELRLQIVPVLARQEVPPGPFAAVGEHDLNVVACYD
jgi:hypothetical protein